MKNIFVMLSVTLMLMFSGSTLAQFNWSGDLQVRPRYDIKNFHDYGGVTKDLYYMLKATLDLKVDVGDGFFGMVRLEHYNYAGYTYTSNAGVPNPILAGSNDIIGRPTVNFDLMYFGIHQDSWGIEGGIFPISGVANPVLDVHYMPMILVDIPFTLYRSNSLVGIQGYVKAGPGNIDYFVSNDQNELYEEDINGTVLNDKHDVYTFGADYSFKVSDFWFQPTAMITWASDSVSAPISYGINLSTPDFSGFKFGGSAAFSTQSVDGTQNYDAQLFRIKADAKFGPGALQVWYDFAKRTDKFTTGDVDHNYGYLWLLYKFPVYSSDHGTFSITPRWRHITETIDNTRDYAREKIELLFAITFK
jgi:hypothetical protein